MRLAAERRGAVCTECVWGPGQVLLPREAGFHATGRIHGGSGVKDEVCGGGKWV